MAIAFDNHASSDTVSGTNILTYSHIASGNNRVLFVSAHLYQSGQGVATGDKLTSITYNGVGMTLIDKSLQTGTAYPRYAYLYGLVNPASGTNNVVVNASDNTNRIISYSVSYQGASQINQPDSHTVNTSANTTNITTNLTTNTDNDWMVSAAIAADTATSAGTNVTIRDNAQFTGAIGDNNAKITPPQSYPMTWNGAGTSAWNVLQASISPASGGFLDLTSKSW